MFEYLTAYKGELTINGQHFNNIGQAIAAFKGYTGNVEILLNQKPAASANAPQTAHQAVKVNAERQAYKITVKQYMTRAATPEFDFHDKWNKGTPMPLRTMKGYILKETAGMYYMELYGVIEATITCMRCGRPLTHPISKTVGIGPECCSKVGVPWDATDFQIEAKLKQALEELTWTGWVIKSAITSKEVE